MDFSPIREYMAKLIDKGVPGCELIICQDHQILFHECKGYSDYEGNKPASPSDLYWMYSCTKPVTAATAMHCVENGLFQLDDPVYKYIPSYKNARVKKDGQEVPARNTMTIRNLMTMTGGLNYNTGRDSIKRMLERTNNQATTVDIANALMEDPLDFEPGERFQYSMCHDVLGAVIEAASGMSFRDYMKKHILDPLGMTRTDFLTLEEGQKVVAAQYTYDAKENKVIQKGKANPLLISPKCYSGGAGLVSCAEDYIKFTDAMSCGGVSAEGVRILKSETIDLMRSEQLPSFHVEGSFSCTCGPDYGYGLGVRTRVAFNEGAVSAKGEFGWDGAAGADMMMDPEHRLSIAYTQHVLNWPAMLGTIHLQIRDILYPLMGL